MRLMCIFVLMIDNIKVHLKEVAAFSAITAKEGVRAIAKPT